MSYRDIPDSELIEDSFLAAATLRDLRDNLTAEDAPILSAIRGATSQTFTASGSFVVPAGVGYVFCYLVGGGGGGGGSGTVAQSGGAGGGGAVRTCVLKVTPGETLTVSVGAGGSGSTTNGAAGGASSVAGASGTVSAAGGAGGTSYGSGGAGGAGGALSFTAAIFATAGYDGEDAVTSSSLGPDGGNPGVHVGAAGRGTTTTGGNGTGYGGGGAGGRSDGGANTAGGNGAPGVVVISY